MSEGAAAVLYDIDGDPMAVENGATIPVLTSSLIGAGSDGYIARFISVDSSGNQIITGLGTAGSPTGGVITIQGIAGGTAIPTSVIGTVTISGTVTANIGTTGGLALDTTLAKLTIAQSTALGSNTQALMGGSVTTAAPTYTTGNINPLSLTTSGALRIDGSAVTQPVSGTVTANAGTGTFTVAGTVTANAGTGSFTVVQSTAANLRSQTASESATGSATPATAGLSGGAVTTAAPTYTNGNLGSLSLTTVGALRIDGSAVTQPVSGAVTANAGTGNFTVVQSTASNLRSQTSSESNTGSAVPTQASMVGGSDGTNLRAIFLDSSGRQIIIGAAANGAAVTGNPVLVAGSDGTNARSIRTATDGTVRVDPTGTTTQPVSGTVAATQSGAWTVSGTGNFSVIGTATDNTANSTAKLPVMAARANTSSPSWSDGNMVPLSVDTAGALRITGAISATNPSVGTNNAAIPASSTQVGGSDGTNLQAARIFDLDTGGGTQFILGVGLRKAGPGGSVELGTPADPIRIDPTGTTTQPISGTVAATQSGTWTVQPGNTANTTPWLTTISQGGNAATVTIANALKVDGSAVTQPVSGTITANIGTSGLLALEATQVKLTIAPGTALGANTQTMVGGSVTTAAPTYTTGNINPLSLTTAGALRIDGSGVTQPVSGTVTANQGTANTLANRWPVIITDGTNTMPTGDAAARSIFNRITDGTNTATVKPASTAPIAGDQALVVVLSPNQPAIPITTSPTLAIQGIAFGDPTYASATEQPVRRTAYTEPSVNFTGSIVSANANDTAAGTGARTVRIYWVDQTGVTAGTEDVTLNGTTNVNLVTATKCFIEKIEVLTAGSGGVNAGIITLRTGLGGGGAIVGIIAAGNNITFWAHHYVITNKTCNVTGTLIGSSSTVAGNGSVYTIKSRKINVSNAVEVQVSDFMTLYGQSSQTARVYGSQIKVVGPARVLMYVTPASGTSNTYRGSFDFYDE